MPTTLHTTLARLGGLLAVAAILAPVAAAHDGPHLMGKPSLGKAYRGLQYSAVGPCAGLYRVTYTSYCSHGPDPEPARTKLLTRAKAASPAAATPSTGETKVECIGDGTSGKRVQVMYVHADNAPDNYAASKASVGAGAVDADRIFRESAAETTGTREVRFVHDSACNLSILDVTVDDVNLVSGNLGLTITDLQAQGFNDPQRKYLIFVDHAANPANDVNCGIGTLASDDQPGAANASNGGPGYARVGPTCWNNANSTAAHELMHTLGAVQNSAPNWNGVGHCLDDTDRMCYDQGVAGFVFNPAACLDHERLFDCNHDDYYHTNPAAGSYLDTHWNTANSDYLKSSLRGLWGFVKANDPVAADYTPASDTNQNSTNTKNTVHRVATGVYEVTFKNLAIYGGNSGTTLATAVGSAGEHCTTSAWVANGTPDTIVTVRCFSAAGNPVDVQFDASFIRPISSGGDFAYLWANDEKAASYTPSLAHQFNSTGGANTIVRNATGNYTVRLPGLSSDGGTVKVTAFSAVSNYCKIEWWVPSGADELVEIRCYDSTGAAVDSKFTMVFADGISILANDATSGYVLAGNPSAASYTPAAATNFNSTGALNTASRTGTGLYTVTLPGLGSPWPGTGDVNRGTVHVTATTATTKRCEVVSWSSPIVLPGSPIPMIVDVACHTSAGVPADSKFVLQFTH